MATFGAAIQKRLDELKKAQADIPRIINKVAEAATIAAVDKATEKTPPNGGAAIAGVNARTGDLAQHWTLDSVTRPVNGKTELVNTMQYASYVDQGHRVDRHFTSHLAVEGGMLVGKPAGDGGLMVGVKTDYVPGRYMVDEAKKKYRSEVHKMLKAEVEKALS
jgi:hypothetical protein